MAEHLTIDPKMGPGVCGMCRRDIPEDEPRLELGLLVGVDEFTQTVVVELCRPCIAEHAPELLETVEVGDVSVEIEDVGE